MNKIAVKIYIILVAIIFILDVIAAAMTSWEKGIYVLWILPVAWLLFSSIFLAVGIYLTNQFAASEQKMLQVPETAPVVPSIRQFLYVVIYVILFALPLLSCDMPLGIILGLLHKK